MFRSYFVIALRHILRNRLYSLINIMGFAVGLAACFLIFLFVSYEASYDNWLPNSDNIYRVNYFASTGSRTVALGWTPGVAKAPLDQRFTEIEQSTRFYSNARVIKNGDKSFEERIWMADPNFFDVFELPFVEGSADAAFDSLSNIVVSRHIAEKYFSDKSPLGETLSFEHQEVVRSYQISGVFEDLPENSEFKFKIIFPLDDLLYKDAPGINKGWFWTPGFLYVKLQNGFDAELINEQLPDLVAQHLPPRPYEGFPDRTVELRLQNLRDIHLRSNYHPFGPVTGANPNGDINQVYTFSVIAVLILIIACVNFINLSTARSMRRIREVGIRKVVGATRGQLVRQFLGENILVVFIGLFFAFVLVDLLLPGFNALLDLSLSFEAVALSSLLPIAVGLVVLVGVISGLYPALYLSAFHPAKTLPGDGMRMPVSLKSLRSCLTIFQFTVSIALIIATAVIYAQNYYSIHKDLGFSKENKLVVRQMYNPLAKKNQIAIADQVRQLPGVLGASLSTIVPAERIGWVQSMSVAGQADQNAVTLTSISIDPDYFSLYDIPVLHGRNLDWEREKDLLIEEKPVEGNLIAVSSALVNQSASRLFGFKSPEAALGQVLHQVRGDKVRRMEIVGVVPDYNYNSVRETIKPLVYNYWPDFFWSLTIQYSEGTNIEALQQQLSDVWDQFVPDVNIKIDFVEDLVREQYASEIKQSKILFMFAGFAILVSCLGLYGLAAFTAEQRSREIAIRKVHGADVWDIVKMLLAQFSKPVLIANVIAWPIAWYLMNDYLSGFVFRIDLTFSYFIGTGIIALIIAWATTTFQAVKVARTSPATVLSSD